MSEGTTDSEKAHFLCEYCAALSKTALSQSGSTLQEGAALSKDSTYRHWYNAEDGTIVCPKSSNLETLLCEACCVNCVHAV